MRIGRREWASQRLVAACLLATTALAAGLLAAGCGKAGAGEGDAGEGPATNGPVAAENNPPGDIPDNQAFVPYRSDGGSFELKVPEGWARSDGTDVVTFTDHLNTIQLNWQATTSPPSTERANTTDVPDLQRTQPAFQLRKVSVANLPGGAAVLIDAQENSPPNSVTGKQYRLDVLRYQFFQNGKQAVLTLSSPAGSDNVDPWKLVSESFRWR